MGPRRATIALLLSMKGVDRVVVVVVATVHNVPRIKLVPPVAIPTSSTHTTSSLGAVVVLIAHEFGRRTIG